MNATMKTCPLCKANVKYVGMHNVECEGVGCQNYKPGAEDEKITRQWIIDLFGKIAASSATLWYYEDAEFPPKWGAPGSKGLKVFGFSPLPLEIAYDNEAPSIKKVREFFSTYYPQWLPLL